MGFSEGIDTILNWTEVLLFLFLLLLLLLLLTEAASIGSCKSCMKHKCQNVGSCKSCMKHKCQSIGSCKFCVKHKCQTINHYTWNRRCNCNNRLARFLNISIFKALFFFFFSFFLFCICIVTTFSVLMLSSIPNNIKHQTVLICSRKYISLSVRPKSVSRTVGCVYIPKICVV